MLYQDIVEMFVVPTVGTQQAACRFRQVTQRIGIIMNADNNSKLFKVVALAIAPALVSKLDTLSAWLLCAALLIGAALHDLWKH